MTKKDTRIIIGCQQRAASWSAEVVKYRDEAIAWSWDWRRRDRAINNWKVASFMAARNAEEARVRMGIE